MKTYSKTLPMLVCAAALFALASRAAAQPDGMAINSIPTLKDTSGSAFGVSDLNNRYTLLVFFSIYNDDSPAILKYFGEMRKRQPFAGKLRVVGVNIDPSPDALERFIHKNKIQFRVLLDLSLDFSNRFSVRKPPSVFLIGPSRTVLYSNMAFGADSLNEIESAASDIMSAGTGKNNPAADKPDNLDKTFMQRKLVGANTRFSKFCHGNDTLLMYVTEDGSLFQFNTGDMKRKLLASDVSTADWSPDCSSIVFAQKEKSGVEMKPLDGAAVAIATEGRFPQWSPRGNFIVFMVRDDVWVHQIATQKRWQISSDTKSVQWSPDGRLLLLTDSKGRASLVSPFSHATLLERLFK